MALPMTFTGRGVEVSEAMKQFFEDKLSKVPHIDTATQINIEVGKTVFHKGNEKDFYLRLLLTMPKAVVRIKKEGPEVYPLMDEMMPALHKKMVHYKDNFRKWEGSETWPEASVIEDIVAVESQDDSSSALYTGYTPKVRRKVITEMAPMSVTEAIERMELLDKEYFIFKDVQSGNVAVVAKKEGEYEVVVAE